MRLSYAFNDAQTDESAALHSWPTLSAMAPPGLEMQAYQIHDTNLKRGKLKMSVVTPVLIRDKDIALGWERLRKQTEDLVQSEPFAILFDLRRGTGDRISYRMAAYLALAVEHVQRNLLKMENLCILAENNDAHTLSKFFAKGQGSARFFRRYEDLHQLVAPPPAHFWKTPHWRPEEVEEDID